ncbi:hydrolase, partial [Streptomyces sp. T21Q-yed]|nr:hydrolase [Streptomyces sp. T21Q-yed]
SGGFALVVGVDRAAAEGSGERLRRHGADIVVGDLAELLARGVSK